MLRRAGVVGGLLQCALNFNSTGGEASAVSYFLRLRQKVTAKLTCIYIYITKGSFSSLSSITALAVFFSRGGRALSAAKVCF